MSGWLLAAIALVPAIAFPAGLACRGKITMRYAALLLANAVLLPAVMAISFAVDQPNEADFALTVALLGLPATLLIAVFVERWL